MLFNGNWFDLHRLVVADSNKQIIFKLHWLYFIIICNYRLSPLVLITISYNLSFVVLKWAHSYWVVELDTQYIISANSLGNINFSIELDDSFKFIATNIIEVNSLVLFCKLRALLSTLVKIVVEEIFALYRWNPWHLPISVFFPANLPHDFLSFIRLY